MDTMTSKNIDVQCIQEQAVLITGRNKESEKGCKKVNKFKTAFPQILATLVQCLLPISLGMMISIPTLVIGVLHNAKTGFSITDTEASRFAGIVFICQPFGSLLSGILTDIFGRKSCMLLVGIPQLAGWIVLYSAQSVLMLYTAAVLMGFSVGFMGAPILSYVGEISQPHLRAVLASFSGISASVGALIIFLLGTLTTWRITAAICAAVPIITAIGILQVPESPIWLLKKGRTKEAEQSLCWLRGWVSPDVIQDEFLFLVQYVNKSKQNCPKLYSPSEGKVYIQVVKHENGPKATEKTEDSLNIQPKNKFEKIMYVFQPEMFRPLRLVIVYFFFYLCACLYGFRPFMVQLFESLHIPIDSQWFTVVLGFLQLTGNICCVVFLHYTGKRLISIICITTCSVMCLLLGLYIMLYSQSVYSNPWIPVILFIVLFFFVGNTIPWILVAEVFPTRGRGVGGGMSAAAFYIIFFVCTETFLDLQSLISLHGVFFFYGLLGLFGVVFLYYYLPETEGKTLEEVENCFKSVNKIGVVSVD